MDLSAFTVFAGGEFRRYDEAKIGLLTHGLQYGTGCFEGIRGYWEGSDRELYLVLLREHYERLHISAKILTMKLPYSVDELIKITVDLCVRNKFEEHIYIRPFIYKASEDIGVRLHNAEDAFAIVPVPFGGYHDKSEGLKCCVSSWRRADDTMAPPRAKITGLYINSALAKSEAVANGFDEAIMLSQSGNVSEGSAMNLFMVRRGVIYTPDPSQNVLEGCTRRAIMQIAADTFNIEVAERAIGRSELYSADEIFLTGTAAGILHVGSVDHRMVGDGQIGPITKKLSEYYNRAVIGREPKYASWLTHTYQNLSLSS